MATYKGIKGVKVQSKASDPTASEADGTVWYNSTGNALKYAIQSGGAWASGGDINNARSRSGSAGASALSAAGYNGAALTTSEEWNDPVYTIKTVTVS